MVEISSFVFFDLETIGLLSENSVPKILELSMVAVHRDSLLEFSTDNCPRVMNKLTMAFYPRKKLIPPDVENITGLHNDNLFPQKDWDTDAGNMICIFLKRLLPPVCLVAHNGNRFDFPILKCELEHIGLDLPPGVYCADSLTILRSPEMFSQEITPDPCQTPIKKRGIVSFSNELTPSGTSEPTMKRVSIPNPNVRRKLIYDQNQNETVNSGQSSASPSAPSNIETTSNGKTDSETTLPYKESHNDEMQNSNTPYNKPADNGLSFVRTPDKILDPVQDVTPVKKTRPSFKLSDIYKRIFGRSPLNAHSAEDDCLSLLLIFNKLATKACKLTDNHAIPFQSIKSPEKFAACLPSGRFPCQE